MATTGATNHNMRNGQRRDEPGDWGEDLDQILAAIESTPIAGRKRPAANPSRPGVSTAQAGRSATPRTAMGENRQGAPTPGEQRLLDNWLTIQGINLSRHANSLRPFTKDEFGSGPAAPSEAHIKAVNRFIDGFRIKLDEMMRWVEAAASTAKREPTSERLRVLLQRKEVAGNRVLYVEGVWDFYFDLFVQRLSSFSERLL